MTLQRKEEDVFKNDQAKVEEIQKADLLRNIYQPESCFKYTVTLYLIEKAYDKVKNLQLLKIVLISRFQNATNLNEKS